MKIFFIILLFPILSFADVINITCFEKSQIDFKNQKILKFDESNLKILEYTFDKNQRRLTENNSHSEYQMMGEDSVSYHFRIETKASFNTLILYKNIYRYERNLFQPNSLNVLSTFYGECKNTTKPLVVKYFF